MQSVVERVLNLLIFLLEAPKPMTAGEIRETVAGYEDKTDDAFHRMFERDKEVLRRIGVPLKMEALDVWEVDFGYTVDPDEYAVGDPGLTQDERMALSLAARVVRLGGYHAGLDALHKLGGVERAIGMEPMGADLGPGSELLGEMFGAITEHRRVEFEYRRQQRGVDPYGMAHRRGHWYLVAGTPDGERIFRIDRIENLRVSANPGQFSPPSRFDVRREIDAQPWEAGEGDEIEARVRFSEEVSWWAARTLGLDDPEGVLEATVPVVNRDAFIGWVLSFGDGAEVLAPVELRSEIRARLEAALAGLP